MRDLPGLPIGMGHPEIWDNVGLGGVIKDIDSGEQFLVLEYYEGGGTSGWWAVRAKSGKKKAPFEFVRIEEPSRYIVLDWGTDYLLEDLK